MGGSDKDGLPADPVHVDASTSLQVIQVDVAVFGDEKDDILLWADLDEQEENGQNRLTKRQIKTLKLN